MSNPQNREAARLWTLALPSVSAFVACQVRDVSLRDDVLQETAVAILDSFDRYDPSQPFTAWAIGIARNQVRLLWRKLSREKVHFDQETLDALARAFESEPLADIRLDFLQQCLESLEPSSRDLCRQRYENDQKPGTLARILGQSANTISKNLQRIRDRLRQCVETKLRALEAKA